MTYLVLDRLAKRYPDGGGVDAMSLSLAQGEILALLGPSGSGKTTTLRLLAGFESPDAGRILVGGDDVTAVAAAERRFGMVFQHYALFPHLSVGANVGFGVVDRGGRPVDRASRIAAALAAVDLAGFEDRAISSLSGGQQQRVALARAIAPEPRVLLLDEPLSNLDPTLRERTRRELRLLIERIGITTVLVTHEQDEAFDLADRIAVLERGRLEQVGTAPELYDRPATPFVAGFVGRSSALAVSDGTGGLILAPDVPPLAAAAKIGAGGGTLVVRPEAFRLVAAGQGWATGTVVERRFTGALAFYRVALGSAPVVLEVAGDPAAAALGEAVGLEPTGRGIAVFPEPRG
jgi:putative spermidine/putrescine transport system ATP-binding protein